MSAGLLVLDTNVFIRHGLLGLTDRGLMSSVVIQEMTAGANDAARIRHLALLSQQLERSGRLLVPTGEDWFYAGKVLNSLYRGQRSDRSRQPVAIPKEEQQRLLRDVLIARSAKRVNAGLLTYNMRDYRKIRRFCDVRLISPADYF
ncbi:type II toxin-antitoxin system VapC family toxin [Longimicrobium sp.]|uniref:type II toxin-antitoxin system VapC family toxin n=1 Tax=Longimicrobium sp. TaxID=2029185 RepID=UPI002E332493|nr:type II toxin-antitoxin system VapC family toxin [Longimicrobium sp.]HEX6041257.1 type II toxin-antitoxin system VapC family toxin [Longimicrobium sp.]